MWWSTVGAVAQKGPSLTTGVKETDIEVWARIRKESGWGMSLPRGGADSGGQGGTDREGGWIHRDIVADRETGRLMN